MAVLPIIIAPDPRLKVVCEPVDDVTDEVAGLMNDMLETMYIAPGGRAVSTAGRCRKTCYRRRSRPQGRRPTAARDGKSGIGSRLG